MNRALVTKVNRQLRQLVEYQMGQITVGKLHPDEEDPFPDGQSGAFDDVGGYPEEYQAFSWTLQREEIPICGDQRGRPREGGLPEGGRRNRARASADRRHPRGQGRARREARGPVQIPRDADGRGGSGRDADEDQLFSIVTYLPVNGEEEAAGRRRRYGRRSGRAGRSRAPAGGANAGKETLDRSGSDQEGRSDETRSRDSRSSKSSSRWRSAPSC